MLYVLLICFLICLTCFLYASDGCVYVSNCSYIWYTQICLGTRESPLVSVRHCFRDIKMTVITGVFISHTPTSAHNRWKGTHFRGTNHHAGQPLILRSPYNNIHRVALPITTAAVSTIIPSPPPRTHCVLYMNHAAHVSAPCPCVGGVGV